MAKNDVVRPGTNGNAANAVVSIAALDALMAAQLAALEGQKAVDPSAPIELGRNVIITREPGDWLVIRVKNSAAFRAVAPKAKGKPVPGQPGKFAGGKYLTLATTSGLRPCGDVLIGLTVSIEPPAPPRGEGKWEVIGKASAVPGATQP